MKLSHYDYLVVGAGISSAVFCHEAAKLGKTCLVIDRRDHIAGNIYTCLLYTSPSPRDRV